MQRCPRNSVEQLGQIEEASFGRLPGTRLEATPVVVSAACGAIVGPDELLVEFNVELMSGVVAQIQLRENVNVSASQCEPRCEPASFRTRRWHRPGLLDKSTSKVLVWKQPGAVPKW